MPRRTKPRPLRFPMEAYLGDLHRQGALVVHPNGRLSLTLPAALATLEHQAKITANRQELRTLLQGLGTCLRLGLPEDRWWQHLERVSANGTTPRVRKVVTTAPDTRPTLPSALDTPPDPTTVDPTALMAIDTETYAPDAVLRQWNVDVPLPWIPQSECLCIGVAVSGFKFLYPIEQREAIQSWLMLPNPKIYITNYDLLWIQALRFTIAGELHDVRWARALEDGTRAGGLKREGAYQYPVALPRDTPDLSKTFSYCACDSMNTLTMFNAGSEWLHHPLYRLYQRLDAKLVEISLTGLPIFRDAWDAEIPTQEAHLRDVEAQLLTIAPIDWRSRKALLTIPDLAGPGCMTKKDTPSFNKDSLLMSDHVAAPLLRDLRTTDRLLDTYLRPHRGRHRLHGRITLQGAWTGRTSSHACNLQQLPKSLRHLFGEEGSDWVTLDVSNAELLVGAVICECTTMLEIFRAGGDVHRETIAHLLSKPIGAITDDERGLAKAINFGMTYGGSWRVVQRKAREAGFAIPQQDAERFTDQWFAAYPQFYQRINVVRTLQDRGEILTSPFGRQWPSRRLSLNECLNAPISSTASDLLLMGLDRVWTELRACGPIVAIVHDEVDCLIPKGSFDEDRFRAIARAMAGVDPHFPLRIAVSVGSAWGTTEERFKVSADG